MITKSITSFFFFLFVLVADAQTATLPSAEIPFVPPPIYSALTGDGNTLIATKAIQSANAQPGTATSEPHSSVTHTAAPVYEVYAIRYASFPTSLSTRSSPALPQTANWPLL